ncbi:MAG: glucosyltransferase domain-containing protein [Lachnospiraceae bacterium]|nr:glucosyltransferase domain-containing protein [Lachnospiraceae bacterium]
MKNINEKSLKEYTKVIFNKLLLCCAVYSMLMTENLVNKQDGMWEGPYYFGDNWELSLGRWAIRYLDEIHFGIASNPWNAILTLLLFVIGTQIFVSVFGIQKGTWKDYILSMLFLSNMVVCISLSYAYTSLIYGLAFLLSMFCVKNIAWAADDNTIGGKKRYVFACVIMGACSLALAMGLYQAYLGCITAGVIGYIVLLLLREEKASHIKKVFGYSGIVAALGFLLYELILHIELKRYDAVMSNYNGADSVSLTAILNGILPSVKRSYHTVVLYFTNKGHHWNMLGEKLITWIVGISVIVLVVWGVNGLIKINKLYTILYVLLISIFPLSVNVVFFLVPGSSFLEQQTAPYALVLPIVFALLFYIFERKQNKIILVKKAVLYVMASFILWGSIYQVQVDQEAMKEGTIAAQTIADSVLDTLIDDGYFQEGKKLVIIGEPIGNPLCKVTAMYDKANNYAKVGGPYWGSILDKWTWRGVFYYRLGVDIPMPGTKKYEKIMNMQEVKDMPVYPQEGSVKEVKGTVVVKISE